MSYSNTSSANQKVSKNLLTANCYNGLSQVYLIEQLKFLRPRSIDAIDAIP